MHHGIILLLLLLIKEDILTKKIVTISGHLPNSDFQTVLEFPCLLLHFDCWPQGQNIIFCMSSTFFNLKLTLFMAFLSVILFMHKALRCMLQLIK